MKLFLPELSLCIGFVWPGCDSREATRLASMRSF